MSRAPVRALAPLRPVLSRGGRGGAAQLPQDAAKVYGHRREARVTALGLRARPRTRTAARAPASRLRLRGLTRTLDRQDTRQR